MDPISNQLPPYSQDEIELYALQRPAVRVIHQEVEVKLLKPYEVMSSPESRKKEHKHKKKERE